MRVDPLFMKNPIRLVFRAPGKMFTTFTTFTTFTCFLNVRRFALALCPISRAGPCQPSLGLCTRRRVLDALPSPLPNGINGGLEPSASHQRRHRGRPAPPDLDEALHLVNPVEPVVSLELLVVQSFRRLYLQTDLLQIESVRIRPFWRLADHPH